MRRHVQYALIAVLIAPLAATAPAVPARAGPIEFLDRLADFAEETLEQTIDEASGAPDGPPPFRIGLMLPRSGPQREAAERIARGWETLARYTAQLQKPLVIAGAVGETVMSQACHDHVARTSFNIGPYQTTSGRYIAGKFKTIVTVGPDSKGGYRLIRRFSKAYRGAGGRVVEQAWATIGRKYDWSALLSRAAQNGPQAIYAFFEGRNAERIVHQHSRTGLKNRIALIGPEWLFGPRALNRRGKHADGAHFLTGYLPDLDTPANRLFVEAYRRAHREDPDAYAYMGYENGLAVLLTAAELNGQVHDGAAFIAAMKKVSYAGFMPRGDFGLNQTNSAFLTRLYWVEAVKDDSGTRLKRLDAIPVDPDTSVCKKQTADNSN